MENQNFEFDEMRNQIAILKNKLNRQEIVSDRLLRQTMCTRVRDIDRTKRMELVACALCFILFPLEVYEGFLTLPFALVSLGMIVFCLIGTIYIHRPVDRINLMTEDLATVASVMARFKRQYDFWLHYVTPTLLIPWFLWACYDYGWKQAPAGTNPVWFCLPIAIGVVIGGITGYTYHRKAVNAAKSIMQQLED